MAIAEAEAGIEKSVILDEERIGRVRCVGTHETKAEVAAEAGKSPFAPSVVGESTELVARRLREPLSDVRRCDVVQVVCRSKCVTAVKVEAVRQTRNCFEFEARERTSQS